MEKEEVWIDCSIRVETVRWYKAETSFGILVVSLVKNNTIINPKIDKISNTFIIKGGNMPQPKIGGIYLIRAKEVNDKKWGMQYDITNGIMTCSIVLNENDKDGQRRYLSMLFTERQVDAMYDTLKDPYKALMDENIEELCKVKGCATKTALSWISKFKQNYSKAKVLLELSQYQLSDNMIDKLITKYKSPEVVIEKVKNNPYTLIEVDGIGWKKCDDLALKGGMEEYCVERVEAFMKYYLNQKANEGYSFIPIWAEDEEILNIKGISKKINLVDNLISFLGEKLPNEVIGKAIKRNEASLWINNKEMYGVGEKSLIGLKKIYNLEYNIAEELYRLNEAPNRLKSTIEKNWMDVIREKEIEQGWNYGNEQLEGIKAIIENNVVFITGGAGVGKTSVVSANLEVFKNSLYSMCALSGRAGARMSEVTGKDGKTIHRLLSYPLGEENYQKFAYNQDNKLPDDIIILDELSMVDAYLFYYLIRSIKTGSKLVMLGDIDQLESIGCGNIALDLIKSDCIKVVRLNEVHRQGKKSEIIKQSIKVKNGEQIIDRDFVGEETIGELQDLTLISYSDRNCTYDKVIEKFIEELNDINNIMDLQVIVPIKKTQSGTFMLNEALQEIYNPFNEDEKELIVHNLEGNKYILREGDKIINTKNNYDTKEYSIQWDLTPEEIEEYERENRFETKAVFNGSMGTIKKINIIRNEIVVNFEYIGDVLIPREKLSGIELGYACTCHKCQGSEFKNVIYALDMYSFINLSKEQVYTGMSRAKKHLTIIFQTDALIYAINHSNVKTKLTHLAKAIYEKYNPPKKEIQF